MARNNITVRRPVFVGCEGESEQAYCSVLRDIIAQTVKDVHFEVVLLGEGAGSPIAKIQKAIKKITQYERTRSKFWKRVVLLDSDLIDQDESQRVFTEKLAADHGLGILWQTPCHEAFLLRHLPNCVHGRPPTSALAHAALVAQWQIYQKPMTRSQVAKKIDINGLRQVVSVEISFRTFLNDIGWQ